MDKYELVVGGTDPITTISKVIEWAKKGASLKEGTYPRLNSIPHRVVMEIETDNAVEGDAFTIVKVIRYSLTKEELESLSWEDFKRELRKVGITGRDRAVMQTKYLTGKE